MIGDVVMLHTFDTRLESMHGFETDYLRVLYYDLPRNYSGKYKSMGYLRFCTILEGEKHLNVGSKSFRYTKDQFLILPSNSDVDMEIPEDTKALVFEISDEMIKSVAAKVSRQQMIIDENSKNKLIIADEFNLQNKKKKLDIMNSSIHSSFILEDHNNDIKDDINSIHSLTKNRSKEESFMIDLYAQRLVYNLLKIHPVETLLSLKSNSELSRSISYIKKNINEHIRVSDLSEIAGMSESNFSHTFKKVYGQSPQKYINASKLEYSLELLKNDSVTNVAFELGFENLSHFIKLFKEKYKTTPKQYQLNYLK